MDTRVMTSSDNYIKMELQNNFETDFHPYKYNLLYQECYAHNQDIGTSSFNDEHNSNHHHHHRLMVNHRPNLWRRDVPFYNNNNNSPDGKRTLMASTLGSGSHEDEEDEDVSTGTSVNGGNVAAGNSYKETDNRSDLCNISINNNVNSNHLCRNGSSGDNDSTNNNCDGEFYEVSGTGRDYAVAVGGGTTVYVNYSNKKPLHDNIIGNFYNNNDNDDSYRHQPVIVDNGNFQLLQDVVYSGATATATATTTTKLEVVVDDRHHHLIDDDCINEKTYHHQSLMSTTSYSHWTISDRNRHFRTRYSEEEEEAEGELSFQTDRIRAGPANDCVTNLVVVPPVRKRNTANKKERRRTMSINNAFSDLRGCIPNVPPDTKLSKIKTLRLATSYISYLMNVLHSDDPDKASAGGFKADIVSAGGNGNRRLLTAANYGTSCFSYSNGANGANDGATNDGGGSSNGKFSQHYKMMNIRGMSDHNQDYTMKRKGRTGWPQHVWALELKPEQV